MSKKEIPECSYKIDDETNRTEFEQLDGMELLSSNEVIDNIKIYDSTV